MIDDDEDDCAICGGPCALITEHDDPTVTAADVKRLEEIGVLRRVSAEEVAAFELRQRQEMRDKYGTDDVSVCMRIITQELARIAGLGSGRES